MGALLQFLKFAAVVSGIPHTDTTTYADRATEVLVARAMARHAAQDSTVHDYTAKLRYRVSFAFAKRAWGDPVPAAVEEQEATLAWQLPNDLRVNLLGRRSASQLDGVDLTSTFSHPWFVPRGLGDSLRIFGASQTPAQAAPHPFARGADRFYRYAAGDSVELSFAWGRITIQSITVTPKFSNGAFVAGRIWVDVATGDVVRFTFRFVGTQLWSEPEGNTAHDSAAATRDSKLVSRILELNADLEYSLQEQRHWMPYRQVIAGRISAPFGIDFAIPFEARTTFDDYRINTGVPIVFDAPFPRDTNARGRNGGRIMAGRDGRPPGRRDSTLAHADSARARGDSGFRRRFRNRTGYLAGGGRYEIHRPPADSMRAYAGWGDSLVFQDSDADRRQLHQSLVDLARITSALPGDMTGRPGAGIAWEHISDILRYNRVEGTTVSLGARLPLALSFAQLYGTIRYGVADERVMARVALIRDAPAGRLTLAVSRDLADVDAFASGLNFSNSLDGIFSGHDDGGYLLAQGLRVTYETSHGPRTEITWHALAEDERSVASDARAFIPRISGANGYFPANAPVREGFAAGAGLHIDYNGRDVQWMVDADGLDAASAMAARLASEFRVPRAMHGWAALRLKGGVAAGVDSVPQLALRVGGLNTVRGYDFGVAQGNAMWAAQLDVSKPGRGVRLVAFADAGQAGMLNDPGAAPFLSGGGVGISVFGGLLRADLSHPITNTAGRGVRLDLMLGSIR